MIMNCIISFIKPNIQPGIHLAPSSPRTTLFQKSPSSGRSPSCQKTTGITEGY